MSTGDDMTLLKALAEESRYMIVKALLHGERCACELPSIIGRTQSNTSMHLAKLANANILSSRKEGKKVLYAIRDPRVRDMFVALRFPMEKEAIDSCCTSKNKRERVLKKR